MKKRKKKANDKDGINIEGDRQKGCVESKYMEIIEEANYVKRMVIDMARRSIEEVKNMQDAVEANTKDIADTRRAIEEACLKAKTNEEARLAIDEARCKLATEEERRTQAYEASLKAAEEARLALEGARIMQDFETSIEVIRKARLKEAEEMRPLALKDLGAAEEDELDSDEARNKRLEELILRSERNQNREVEHQARGKAVEESGPRVEEATKEEDSSKNSKHIVEYFDPPRPKKVSSQGRDNLIAAERRKSKKKSRWKAAKKVLLVKGAADFRRIAERVPHRWEMRRREGTRDHGPSPTYQLELEVIARRRHMDEGGRVMGVNRGGRVKRTRKNRTQGKQGRKGYPHGRDNKDRDEKGVTFIFDNDVFFENRRREGELDGNTVYWELKKG